MRLTKYIFVPFAMGLVSLVGCSGEPITPLERFETVPPPMMVTVVINNYCTSTFVDFFAKPMSFEVQNGVLQPDSNRDGLTDVEATSFGLDPFDAPASGITDFIALEYLGLNVSQLPGIPVCPNPTQASSGDVLTDCQKNSLGLTPITEFDSAHRGFPDSLAVYARLPLFDSNVAEEDLAGDGIQTIQKIKWNLPPDESVTPQSETLEVTYTTDTAANPLVAGQNCYTFTITSPRAGVANGDLYNFYFIATGTSGVNQLITKKLVVPLTVPNGATEKYSYDDM